MTDGQLALWVETRDNAGRPVVRSLCEPVGWAYDVTGPTASRLLGPPASPWPRRHDHFERNRR